MTIKKHYRPSAPAVSYLLGSLPKIAPVVVDRGLERDAKAVSQSPLAMTLTLEEPLSESPEQLRRVARKFVNGLLREMGRVQFGCVCFIHQDSLGDKGKGGGL
jgi:hypothetical protein